MTDNDQRQLIREQFDQLLRDLDTNFNSNTIKPRFGQRYPELAQYILDKISPYTPPAELENFWL